MKAIPTIYRGVKFRSRLEARWAVFFDSIAVEWEYEPEGYVLAGQSYLPDFWLPKVRTRGRAPGGVFFEVKGNSPTADERGKASMLAWGSEKPVLIVSGEPKEPCLERLHEFVGGMDGWEDYGLLFGRCDLCGGVSADFFHGFKPKQCGCRVGAYDPLNQSLELARAQFQRSMRWEAAA